MIKINRKEMDTLVEYLSTILNQEKEEIKLFIREMIELPEYFYYYKEKYETRIRHYGEYEIILQRMKHADKPILRLQIFGGNSAGDEYIIDDGIHDYAKYVKNIKKKIRSK